VRISLGKIEKFSLGNIYSKRDWCHAKDSVYAMWLILQKDSPDDYVISSNVQYTIKECVEEAFKNVGVKTEWRGEGMGEKCYKCGTDTVLIDINDKYFRPSEVEDLLGDSSYAYEKLGWKPRISFQEMIKEMVECDLLEESGKK
jgi:GDPmannose 4,6-dehydratase